MRITRQGTTCVFLDTYVQTGVHWNPKRWDHTSATAQVETIYLGDRKISIRTSVLEEKATACNMLCCYADELKDGFYPWVEQARQRHSRAPCIDLLARPALSVESKCGMPCQRPAAPLLRHTME